ncbi:hypothetical protein [Actinokineospora sp. HUAS TT18]|uniref:hypothetical protein n=1 Tax=Actinokineospora sp. HUAS TT18 TaxID=3447451 RepID=UPI003F51F093
MERHVEVSPVVRVLIFFPVTAISALVFVILTLLSGYTETLFAWPMRSPLTAATLGAGFGAAAVLLGLALRERYWVNARIAALAPLLLLGLTLIASVSHLGEFPLKGGPLVGFIVSWLWMLAHVGLPFLAIIAVGVQLGKRGTAPERETPLPRWARSAVDFLAVTMVLVGGLFFISPNTFTGWWPWEVSALDLRALSAWAVTFGVAMVFAVWEDDLRRVRIGLAAFIVFGGLALIALLRYAGQVRWDHPSAWIYLAVVGGLVVAGAVGLRLAGKPFLSFGDRPVLAETLV